MPAASATGATTMIRPRSATGSLSSSIASARQNGRCPVASSTARQSPRGARGTGGRWAASHRLAVRRSPSASCQTSRATAASSGSPIQAMLSTAPSSRPPPTTTR
jgi:hypothetical protein